MKKLIKTLFDFKALFMILAICLSSCSIPQNPKTQSMYANDILNELIVAMESDDSESIKMMFSENVRKSPELEDQIQEMLDYFEGEVAEFDEVKDCSGDESIRNGEIEYSHITNAQCNKIVTDKYTYMLSFAYYIVDESKSDEGMHRIWIGKSEDDYLIVGNKKG